MRLEAHGARIACERLLVAPDALQSSSEVRVQDCARGLQLHGRPDQAHRSLRLSARHHRQPEQTQRFDVARLLSEHLLIQRHGLIQATLSMKPDRLCQGAAAIGHVDAGVANGYRSAMSPSALRSGASQGSKLRHRPTLSVYKGCRTCSELIVCTMRGFA